MSRASQAAEPSMEDILASIRKIISDDDTPAPKTPAREQASTPAGQDDIDNLMNEHMDEDAIEAAFSEPLDGEMEEEEEDTLDLTEEASEDEAAFEEDLTEDTGEDASDIMFVESPVEEEEETPPPPPVRKAAKAAPKFTADDDEGLLSPQVGDAVASAFGSLSGIKGLGPMRDQRTMEDFVSEMMRPMLKEWLDAYLPSLVERLVREEIERVTRGRI